MLPPTRLANAYTRLKSTGRGKHIGAFSYYHLALFKMDTQTSATVAGLREALGLREENFNVIKLDPAERISFLLYEDFREAFPALLAATSCHLGRGYARRTNYAARNNPPILHRKELLLPGSHPLVAEAECRTRRLERAGAFRHRSTIGTRLGWQRRLDELGVDEDGRPLK